MLDIKLHEAKKSIFSKWWFWLFLVLFLLFGGYEAGYLLGVLVMIFLMIYIPYKIIRWFIVSVGVEIAEKSNKKTKKKK